jgi:hypothetical protein
MFVNQKLTIKEWILLLVLWLIPLFNIALLIWMILRRGLMLTLYRVLIAFVIYITLVLLLIGIFGF